MKSLVTRDAFIATIAVIAALAPFLNKAFHIDDVLFLWIAQQISRHPADPYGFLVNWYVTSEPMSSVMQNPPLGSYYMSLVANFLGWSEPAMHGAFLVPAIAAVLGTFVLARRLSGSPLFAAVLLVFMPVFLVSATGVMCDVWLLALWVWSIECWLRGLERNSFWLLLFSAILAAAAALTKYFGITLVPLLGAYTLVRERGLSHRLLYLSIPIVVIASYEAITKAKYGQGLFSSAMLYSWRETARPQRHFFEQLCIGFSFAGGCLVPIAFYAPFLKSRSREAGSFAAGSGKMRNFQILIIGITIFAVLVPVMYFGMASAVTSKSTLIPVAIERALFVTTGIGLLALAVADVIQRKTADSLLLALWVLGTFLFAAMMNWSITSRTFLPMAPAVVILLIRRLQRDAIVAAPVNEGGEPILPLRTATQWWPILPAALVSLFVTAGDYRLANAARQAASNFQERYQSNNVWFEGHWGFQYYMQQWNAKPLDAKQGGLVSGDVLIVAINNTNVQRRVPLPAVGRREHMNFPQFPATTMNSAIRAGFYSSIWGELPWAAAPVPPEPYLILHIK
jgi:4-amino-4-deoxy-L-arabinose transferase-like glycosyltransferase